MFFSFTDAFYSNMNCFLWICCKNCIQITKRNMNIYNPEMQTSSRYIGPGGFRGCEAGHCFHWIFFSFLFLSLLLFTHFGEFCFPPYSNSYWWLPMCTVLIKVRLTLSVPGALQHGQDENSICLGQNNCLKSCNKNNLLQFAMK